MRLSSFTFSSSCSSSSSRSFGGHNPNLRLSLVLRVKVSEVACWPSFGAVLRAANDVGAVCVCLCACVCPPRLVLRAEAVVMVEGGESEQCEASGVSSAGFGANK